MVNITDVTVPSDNILQGNAVVLTIWNDCNIVFCVILVKSFAGHDNCNGINAFHETNAKRFSIA